MGLRTGVTQRVPPRLVALGVVVAGGPVEIVLGVVAAAALLPGQCAESTLPPITRPGERFRPQY